MSFRFASDSRSDAKMTIQARHRRPAVNPLHRKTQEEAAWHCSNLLLSKKEQSEQKWKRRVSIPVPRACEARALPIELRSLVCSLQI